MEGDIHEHFHGKQKDLFIRKRRVRIAHLGEIFVPEFRRGVQHRDLGLFGNVFPVQRFGYGIARDAQFFCDIGNFDRVAHFQFPRFFLSCLDYKSNRAECQ